MSEAIGRTALYRIRGEADVLLYIGISNHLSMRWNNHQAHQPWWDELRSLTVEVYDSREEAEAAEKAAIQAEWPKYNMTYLAPHRRRRVLAVVARTPQSCEFVTPAEPEALLTRDEPVNREELSWYLGVSQSTLARWACRSYGPPFDAAVNGYRGADVKEWLLANRRNTGSFPAITDPAA